MNHARKINQVTNSNPISVLKSIGATQCVVNCEPIVEPATPLVSATEAIPPKAEHASSEVWVQLYRGEPTTGDSTSGDASSNDVMQNALESALQIQQLAARLKINEESLQQREQELESQISQWNESVLQQQTELETRLSHLEQNASQVRCQQLHLMQLQTDIVKSYEATKEVISSLVAEQGSNLDTITSLEKLKYEISGRFDYISRRWSHLANLMQQGRDEDTAERGVDDSIDWTV